MIPSSSVMPEDKAGGQSRSGVRSCDLPGAKVKAEEPESDPGSLSQSHASPPGLNFPTCKMGVPVPTFL